MDKELNQKIDNRINELRRYKISNRYSAGYDSYSDGSQQAFAVFDWKTKRLRYITNKQWKVKLGLLIARIFGWKIITERSK